MRAARGEPGSCFSRSPPADVKSRRRSKRWRGTPSHLSSKDLLEPVGKGPGRESIRDLSSGLSSSVPCRPPGSGASPEIADESRLCPLGRVSSPVRPPCHAEGRGFESHHPLRRKPRKPGGTVAAAVNGGCKMAAPSQLSWPDLLSELMNFDVDGRSRRGQGRDNALQM